MLKSERLQFIPLNESHAEGLYELWGNPMVVKYIMCPLKNSVPDCKAWINKLLTDLVEPNVFTVFCNQRIIGIGGVPCWHKEEGDYGLYYQLAEKYWGDGFGIEIATTLSEYAFIQCNAEKISTYAVTENTGSNHILQKLGMHITGSRDGGFIKGEITYDENHYTITKGEWNTLYAKNHNVLQADLLQK